MTLKELSKEVKVYSRVIGTFLVYECPICKSRFDKINEVENCVDSHNLIFDVYKTQMKYDEESGTVVDDLVFWKSFNTYKEVREFEGVYPYKIVINKHKGEDKIW